MLTREDVNICIESIEDEMQKAIEHLQNELKKIRAGKANPDMLNGIMVDYYGSPTPLQQVANVSTPDARTIAIQPWEKSMIEPLEKAILVSNIGLTPSNDGEIIRLNIPPLTEERRKDLVKQTKAEGETAKVSIRNSRKHGNDELKKMLKDGLSENMHKEAESMVQDLTDKFSKNIDAVIKEKEVDIMTV